MRVLVFNCGSSSLKFDLIEIDSAGARAVSLGHGLAEEIGSGGTRRFVDAAGMAREQPGAPPPDHPAAALEAIAWLEAITAQSPLRPAAIVHRFVHGGPELTAPVIVDEAVIRALDAAAAFDPLHYPPAIATLRATAT